MVVRGLVSHQEKMFYHIQSLSISKMFKPTTSHSGGSVFVFV